MITFWRYQATYIVSLGCLLLGTTVQVLSLEGKGSGPYNLGLPPGSQARGQRESKKFTGTPTCPWQIPVALINERFPSLRVAGTCIDSPHGLNQGFGPCLCTTVREGKMKEKHRGLPPLFLSLSILSFPQCG